MLKYLFCHSLYLDIGFISLPNLGSSRLHSSRLLDRGHDATVHWLIKEVQLRLVSLSDESALSLTSFLNVRANFLGLDRLNHAARLLNLRPHVNFSMLFNFFFLCFFIRFLLDHLLRSQLFRHILSGMSVFNSVIGSQLARAEVHTRSKARVVEVFGRNVDTLREYLVFKFGGLFSSKRLVANVSIGLASPVHGLSDSLISGAIVGSKSSVLLFSVEGADGLASIGQRWQVVVLKELCLLSQLVY